MTKGSHMSKKKKQKQQYAYKRKYIGMTAEQLRNSIRQDWMNDDNKFAAIQSRAERIQIPDGRFKTFIRCCGCSGLFDRKQIEAHHINPVGRLESTDRQAVEAFMARMFVKAAQIQPLCVPCHRKVTAQQRTPSNSGDNNALQTIPTDHTPQPRMG
jgi:hypothetical protein